MRFDVLVLRAMLRLARRRQAADADALGARVGGTRGELRAALRRLDQSGLVERTSEDGGRLTFSGFAIALATLKVSRVDRRAAPSRRAKSTRAA